MPTAHLGRHLAAYNLAHARDYATKRKILAKCHRDNLSGTTGLTCTPPAPQALSHYTISVKPNAHPAAYIKREYR